jgi:hypothetical protein
VQAFNRAAIKMAGKAIRTVIGGASKKDVILEEYRKLGS